MFSFKLVYRKPPSSTTFWSQLRITVFILATPGAHTTNLYYIDCMHVHVHAAALSVIWCDSAAKEGLAHQTSAAHTLPLLLTALRMVDKIKLQLIKLADLAKQPQTANSSLVIPALLETFSRILLWTGTKIFQSKEGIGGKDRLTLAAFS